MRKGAVAREGYKKTELGWIPEDWEVKRLGELCEAFQYGSSQRSLRCGQVPVLRMGNIQDGEIDWNDLVFSNDEIEIRRFLLEPNMVLFNRTNSPELVGKTAIYRGGREAIFAGYLICIKHNKEKLNAFFLNYSFNTKKAKEWKLAVRTDGVSQSNINAQTLASFLFPLPPLPEQKKIAEILSTWDEAIEKLNSYIQAKRKLKKALMQRLLTGKQRFKEFIFREGYKKTELGWIPEDWEVKRLGELAEVYSGGTPSTAISEYYGGEILWINSGDLNKTKIFSVEGRITELGLRNSSAKIIQPETLLIALYGATAGVVAISKIEAAINQAVLAIIPRRDFVYFLLHQLIYLQDFIKRTYKQGGQANLSGELVKSCPLVLPPLPEQKKIAEILSKADEEIDLLNQELEKLKTQKKGLMQKLLTGAWRVKL